MKRLRTVFTILIACGLVSGGSLPAYAAKTSPKTKTAAKAKPASKPVKKTPQPSQETLTWGKTKCNEADGLLTQGQYEKARDIYSQVLWKLPASPRAKEGLKKAEAAIVARQEREKKAAQEKEQSGQKYAQERLEIDQQSTAPPPADFETMAREVVSCLSSGNFNGACARFNSIMKQKMTPAQLKQTWDQLLQKNGAFKEQVNIRSSQEQGLDTLYVTCAFEQTSLDVKVVFDENKQVTGLWVVPVQQQQ